MSHYFENDPNIKSNRAIIEYVYEGTVLSYYTDHGVFSKGKIDFGSDLLIKTFLSDVSSESTKNILDVGCGYGPIGLTCAKVMPFNQFTLVDVNERALELAKDNKKLNHIDNVEIYKSDCLDEILNQKFDLVMTNPPIRAGKDVVHKILEQSEKVITAGGALYVVIQKKQGMPSAKEKMQLLFGNAEIVKKSKGYYIIKSVKT